jgi:hypothetical protein
MGHIAPRKEIRLSSSDPLTRAVTALLYVGMLAVIAASLWSGIRGLSTL